MEGPGARVLVQQQQQQQVHLLSAEFALTGLGRADGNRANHELGICVPHLTLTLSPSCGLTLKPKYATTAFISLLTTGRGADGRPNLPGAGDPPGAVADAVSSEVGYYYLAPRRCPQVYSSVIQGPRLQAGDIAAALRQGLGVGAATLPTAAFTNNGLLLSWLTAGPVAQELSYTAIFKSGGATAPNFEAYRGATDSYCSLLDINPAYDLDTNPADGAADAATTTLVGRVPRAVPGRPGYYICAIAPAGGYVRARRGGRGGGGGGGLRYALAADAPVAYAACGAGSYLYRLGGVGVPGDASTDSCRPCPRGAYAGGAAALCAACPRGMYQDRPGQRSCRPCEDGFAPYAGAARCMACYYGRPYCAEGYAPDDGLYTCNARRLPDGYAPEAGFSFAHAASDPTRAEAAAAYSPTFRNCSVAGYGASLLGLNVSAECAVSLYVLGDLGREGGGCSQDAPATAITAHYTAPNRIATTSSRGIGPFRVGFVAALDAEGLSARVFATGAGTWVPDEIAGPTEFKLVLPESGWGYLGGGDNGQGQNANVKGVNFDPCPAGTTKVLLNGDGRDDPGEDPGTLLASYCVPCGAGQYCPADAETPQNCPPGTFGPAIGAKDQVGCADCPIGTYQTTDGALSCIACAANTFAPAPGATECISCGDGYEVSAAGSKDCNPCGAGLFRDSAVSEQCLECAPGSFSIGAAAQCSPCEPGTYSRVRRAASCTECPRGSYQKSHGSTKCELCPAGSYGDSRGSATCKVCPVGTHNPDCGSVSPTSCIRCPSGTAAPRPGSGVCSGCGPGYYSDRPGLSSCRACPPGTSSAGGAATACAPCAKGMFSDEPASKACAPCPTGTYSPTTGAARCMSCPAGGFAGAPGAVSCSRCAPGTYSTRSAAGSAVACAPCPAGTYSFQDGATKCLACAAGSFADAEGATGCSPCPLGSYAAAAGARGCLPCRDGWTTAAQGSKSGSECAVRVSLNGR
ncbi:MAG: hypothetical protein J3K34DRAFT_525270 [Monoraphidium minutum]|nr:MAG: hypothetical protein J3K34DRAFT_525270 [Monoraphidium minutum]